MDVGGCQNNFFESVFKRACLSILALQTYPSNQQFELHFMEFLNNGYKPSMGCVDIRFDHGSGDRSLKLHDVKFVDGQTSSDCEHPQLKMVLSSFVGVRCTYQFFENESDHYLHSLRHPTQNFTPNQTVFGIVCLFPKQCGHTDGVLTVTVKARCFIEVVPSGQLL